MASILSNVVWMSSVGGINPIQCCLDEECVGGINPIQCCLDEECVGGINPIQCCLDEECGWHRSYPMLFG